jgi:hypothetical protein
MKPMQKFAKSVADRVIGWAVPIVCAATLALWDKIPPEAQHYWPVACIAVVGVCALIMSCQDRRDMRTHIKMHDERKVTDAAMLKAFRAILDAEMGSIYAACMARGYTTEDERRMFNRLHNAYKGANGNGEADRRKVHFDALPDEEEWRARHANKGG